MPRNSGFTLIELSIVLVIIGLLAAGILVGQDLVWAAKIRRQITQIEKFDTAINAFRLKYNAVPGDLVPATAASLGLAARSGQRGHGDGNGSIEGCTSNDPFNVLASFGCEHALFWSDLSMTNFIEEGFILTTDGEPVASNPDQVFNYFPRMKAADNISVHLHSYQQKNWYIFALITTLDGTGPATMNGRAIEGSIAYTVDVKIDDGLPSTGKAQVGSILGGIPQQAFFGPPLVAAISCFDATGQYKHIAASSFGIYCQAWQVRVSGM